MLFIDDSEPQFRYRDSLLDKSMGSNDKLNLAAGDPFQRCAPIFGGLGSGQKCGFNAQCVSVMTYVAEMLLG